MSCMAAANQSPGRGDAPADQKVQEDKRKEDVKEEDPECVSPTQVL